MSNRTLSFLERDTLIRAKRKKRDAAALLPVLGIILLLTPLISAFTRDTTPGGIPNGVYYVFGVWLFLIALTRLMAKHLATEIPD